MIAKRWWCKPIGFPQHPWDVCPFTYKNVTDFCGKLVGTWNPNDLYFCRSTPPKQGLFQSKQGSFGSQVNIIYQSHASYQNRKRHKFLEVVPDFNPSSTRPIFSQFHTKGWWFRKGIFATMPKPKNSGSGNSGKFGPYLGTWSRFDELESIPAPLFQ